MLSVIVLHLNIRVPFDGGALGHSLPKPSLACWFWSGSWGDGFLVISGFLITSMTEARSGDLGRVDVRAFYRIRFARIAPMLALFVLVQSVLQRTGVTGFSDPAPAASLSATLFPCSPFTSTVGGRSRLLAGHLGRALVTVRGRAFLLRVPTFGARCTPPVHRYFLWAVRVGFVIAGPFARVSKSSNEMWQDHSYLSCMGEIAIGCLAASLARCHGVADN